MLRINLELEDNLKELFKDEFRIKENLIINLTEGQYVDTDIVLVQKGILDQKYANNYNRNILIQLKDY